MHRSSGAVVAFSMDLVCLFKARLDRADGCLIQLNLCKNIVLLLLMWL